MSFYPYVATKHPKMDLVIIRENEEDLYAGIEHQQTDEVVQCLKLISRPGCEKIVRYAFEYARNAGRKKVTCFSKDNIMKQTDGLFREVFNEIAAEYPDIENDHWIIDIGSALLAEQPESFDVIVTLNLYGDIISDIAAQITGSVGLAGSANIGQTVAMFEAIHGSAPMIAGKNIANPTGLLQAAVMLLNYVGQGAKASEIQNALLATIESGIHTADIYKEGVSKEKVGTKEFADAVIAHLGQAPKQLNAVSYSNNGAIVLKPYSRPEQKRKDLKGVDVFVHWDGYKADELAAKMNPILPAGAHLSMITNRGIKVWPNGFDETFCTDHWRCRIKPAEGETLPAAVIPQILSACLDAGIDTIKTENLYDFNGKAAYSLGQGQ
jgi:isocitrate dehydrogenase